MPKVSDEYKERKRQSVLESALKCFGEKGYHLTTMDDIVAYSKMSKGLIYNYFKSKEELYLSLMDERSNRALDDLQKRFKQIPEAKDKLRELFRIYREAVLAEEWRSFIRVHLEFWLYSSRQEQLRELMNNRYKHQFRDFLSEIIEEGKKAGEFKSDVQVEFVAGLFWAFIDGICLHYSVLWEDYAYIEHFKETEEMVMNYILARSH
ncbi:TetR/AcrR family transcriptional regulator [Bacillus sp. BRMEA1]|uniref:TetR/AcrR family transcriptional regulator n=1 Tax=Neobacillus endophyticus TaxID=2738405 RepID=UPI001564437F|nr:TetR/AcrR family transcriptional regulator [Neobacillus endophyticus]NRD80068.1 TetR/AcrR family transcriptional regulator [Neobacillus endophyticus]